MSIPFRRPAFLAALAVGIALLPSSLEAQRGTTGRAEADSVSRVIPRLHVDDADATLRTRDRRVGLMLTGDEVVMQLTDLGLHTVKESIADEPREGVGGRILAAVLSAGVVGMLDHGIAYRLSALRSARAEGSTLVLEDRQGNRIFSTTEVNGRRPMDSFHPAEAERFAAAVNRAIRRAR